MASVSAPHLPSPSPYSSFPSHTNRRSCSLLAAEFRRARPRYRRGTENSPETVTCRCQGGGFNAKGRWESFLQDAVKSAAKRWEDCVESFWRSSRKPEKDAPTAGDLEQQVKKDADWDWERWKRHFEEVEERERLVSILKSQLHDSVCKEDYEDAARLKRAISAIVECDTVGNAIKHLNMAVAEERYLAAASIRDHAGVGLIGWWAGVSEDSTDPYGRIIQITAEHGRYLAKSYSSRQLAAGKSGFPLFEIYFTLGTDGKYKHQAVYFKRTNENCKKNQNSFSKTLDDGNSVPSVPPASVQKSELPMEKDRDVEESDDDFQISDCIAGIKNVLRDMVPGVNVKLLKVVAPGEVDRDLIANIVEQIMDDEEDDSDREIELEILESENGPSMGSDSKELEINTDRGPDVPIEGKGDLSIKFVIGSVVPNFSLDVPPKDFVRVPAGLDKSGHSSFSFSIIQDDNQLVDGGKESISSEKDIKHSINADLIMSDLGKLLASEKKVSLKVMKDIGEFIRFRLNQELGQQPLHGTMFFNRIDVLETADPLTGLYVSGPGMLTTEVICLRHKFGQWHEDGTDQMSTDIKFYEYVEAFKLTGDPSIPAGQVSFRAKVGKHNQLPLNGIVPEEFGVVARYKGQGRLVEPGFGTPRWVDGELVILDGNYIRGGPIIGFIYWVPERPFLTFFNRLKLQNSETIH